MVMLPLGTKLLVNLMLIGNLQRDKSLVCHLWTEEVTARARKRAAGAAKA